VLADILVGVRFGGHPMGVLIY